MILSWVARREQIITAIAIMLTGIGWTPRSSGDELEDMRALIADGIASNMASIRSFEAQLNESEESTISPESKATHKREIKRTVLFDGTQWRQGVATTVLDTPTGTQVPYSSDSVFDGDTTLRLRSRERNATMDGGNAMEFVPSKDLCYGYTFWDWPLPDTLRFATSIAMAEETGTDKRTPLLRVVLPSTRKPARVTTLWLDPSAGFLIIKARRELPVGTVIGERTQTKVFGRNGSWFLIAGKDELWNVEGEQRRIVGSKSWNAKLASVNEVIPRERFKVDLPARTLVVDNVAGIKTLTGGEPEEERPAPRNTYSLSIIIGSVAVGIVVLVVFCVRRMCT